MYRQLSKARIAYQPAPYALRTVTRLTEDSLKRNKARNEPRLRWANMGVLNSAFEASNYQSCE